jgi:2-polyprenyl-3-methyl-5-hydroxy-6-metoxy-1,4-benzoquinol methylase
MAPSPSYPTRPLDEPSDGRPVAWGPVTYLEGREKEASLTTVEAIDRRHEELGDAFPRIGLFLFDCADGDALARVLGRLPKSAAAWLEEVVVVPDQPSRVVDPLPASSPFTLRVHRAPRPYGYGGARKAAFEYALRRGMEYVVVLRGDGTHPPEALAQLLAPIVLEGSTLAFATRRRQRWTEEGMASLFYRLGYSLACAFQNRVLGLRLRDYLSGFRVYPTSALECVPFQLGADDRSFDVELVIQLRGLGLSVLEVPIDRAWAEDPTPRQELGHALRACRAAIGYRLHQLHLTRRGRYLIEPGVHYTLKHSKTGSHMQIVDAIASESRVLDLGCSQGLLARPLREKSVRVTGVDADAPRGLARELETYHQRDLEDPLDVPEGRVFDYVVIADVVEHLRNREQLLRGARRFLKPGGRLLVSTPNIALWFYRLSLLAGRFEYGARGVLDRTHVHLFTRATFRREVERSGFHVVGERVTALPFEVVFESTGRSRLLRAIARAYHRLARLWPEMFAYQFILEAEITTLDEEATTLR